MLPNERPLKGYEICQKSLNDLPKPKTLAHYFSPAPVFTSEECDALSAAASVKPKYGQPVLIHNNEFKIDAYADGGKVNYFLDTDPVTAPFYTKLIKLIQTENTNLWNYKIVNFGEPLKISSYTEGHGTCVRRDMAHDSISIYRKLSVIVQLSDEGSYEGGDFLITDGANGHIKGPRAKGSVIIFPSFLQHMVSTVVKGKRDSVVMFVYGPPFC